DDRASRPHQDHRRLSLPGERPGPAQIAGLRREGRLRLEPGAPGSHRGTGECQGRMKASILTTAWRYAPILLLVIIWEAGTRLGIISTWALPTFDSVVGAWVGLLDGGELLYHAGASLMRGAAGLGLSIVIGTLLGILMAWIRPIRIVFNPI